MKEVKLLDRVQAVLPFYINLILATIQEPNLISELTNNKYCHISLQFDLLVYTKNVKLLHLSHRFYCFL